MATPHRQSEGSTGAVWGVKFCKASSTEVPVSAIQTNVEITVVTIRNTKFGCWSSRLGPVGRRHTTVCESHGKCCAVHGPWLPQPKPGKTSACCPPQTAAATAAPWWWQGWGVPSLSLGSLASTCPQPDSISNYPPSITFSLLPQHLRENTHKTKHIAGDTLFWKSSLLQPVWNSQGSDLSVFLGSFAAAFHDPTFDVLMFFDGKDPQYYSRRYTNHLIFSTQGSHNLP